MVTEDGLRQQFEEIKKSDDTIRTIGQRYQMLSEEIDAWIWEISFDGRLINASAQVQDILGYRPGELVGKTFSDLLAPSDSARIASGLTGLIAKKEEFRSLLLPVVHRNGRELTLELPACRCDHGMDLFTDSTVLHVKSPLGILLLLLKMYV